MIRKRNNTIDVDEQVSPVLVLGAATFGVLGISSVFLASLASFFPVPARSQTKVSLVTPNATSKSLPLHFARSPLLIRHRDLLRKALRLVSRPTSEPRP